MRIGQLPLMEYYPPGSPDIALVLAKLAPHHRAFLLKNHGPIVTGIDIFDAVDNAEELEETAKLTFLLQNSSIRYLSDTEIDKLISTQ
jgi:ribulose-5-phosphate 4-epimerase/fuculose-1-phosphate aldolase